MFPRLLYLLLLTATLSPLGHTADSAALLEVAEQHIRQETQGFPGKTMITMGRFNADNLPHCTTYEAYTPQGSRLTGKTHIGVRCLAPNRWSALIPAQIAVIGSYVTTQRALVAGQTVQANDLLVQQGDLGSLPSGAINDPVNAIGKTLRNSLGQGQVLRKDQLLSPILIQPGQVVRVSYKGKGFNASTEGKAINAGAENQVVQVRTASGQSISGIVQPDGSIEIRGQ